MGGSADTTSNYDNGYKLEVVVTTGTFSDQHNINMTSWEFAGGVMEQAQGKHHKIFYIYIIFSNASEYSYTSWENTTYNHSPQLFGAQGEMHTQ